jgi:hypothetical protein
MSDKWERIWEEAVVAYFRCNPVIRLEVLRKTGRTLVRLSGNRVEI